jgi:hypothetical protein
MIFLYIFYIANEFVGITLIIVLMHGMDNIKFNISRNEENKMWEIRYIQLKLS